jgi:hypothetical protein
VQPYATPQPAESLVADRAGMNGFLTIRTGSAATEAIRTRFGGIGKEKIKFAHEVGSREARAVSRPPKS